MAKFKLAALPGCPLEGLSSCTQVVMGPTGAVYGIPVCVVGLIGYGALATLAVLAIRMSAVRVAVYPVAEIGYYASMLLVARLLGELHAVCGWCIASAVNATIAMFPASVASGVSRRRLVVSLAVGVVLGASYTMVLSHDSAGPPGHASRQIVFDEFLAGMEGVRSIAEAEHGALQVAGPTVLFVYDRHCPRCVATCAEFQEPLVVEARRGVQHLRLLAQDDLRGLKERGLYSVPIVLVYRNRPTDPIPQTALPLG